MELCSSLGWREGERVRDGNKVNHRQRHEVGGWRECGREDMVHNETQMCKDGEREIKAMRMKQVSSYCIEKPTSRSSALRLPL